MHFKQKLNYIEKHDNKARALRLLETVLADCHKHQTDKHNQNTNEFWSMWRLFQNQNAQAGTERNTKSMKSDNIANILGKSEGD